MQPTALNDYQAAADRRKWLVCGMLLLSLVLNYMDRQTLSLTITAIEQEIGLNNTQYGRLEKGFGYAFAIGAVAFGMIADQVSIRWLYPLVLLGWSAAGLATGYADRLGAWLAPQLTQFVDLRALSLGSEAARSDIELSDASLTAYLGFFVCRVVLGFFESGLWPCALITTQRLLSRGDRPLGNSMLQSGASLGAILTPVVVGAFAPAVSIAEGTSAAAAVAAHAGWWRSPFVVIGALGLLWIGPWFWMVWGLDLSRPPVRRDETTGKPQGVSSRDRLVFARRFIALLFVVIVLNMVWQYFRVWLPKMLEQFHHYSPAQVRYFVIAYYIATDLGCLGSGLLVKWMVRRGTHVHTARLTAFGICALLTSLSTVAAGLPKGPLLLSLFLVIGFGALGLFPNYYSFTQELSERHQGKISGTLGFTTWVITSEMQELIGKEVDRTQSYEQAIFWIGLTPLVGLAAMLLLWGRQEPSK